jgi:AcrR family transcriptional regulator
MARRSPAPRDTRERILRSALEVFEERGYRAASIDEIAARAGVTKGAIYYWFTDKDDLARDLQNQLWEELKAAAVSTLDPEADVLTNLERGLDAYLSALRHLGSARFFLRDAFTIPSLATDTDQREASLALMRALLDEGVRRGELLPLDVYAMAAVLVGAYSEATLHILTTGSVAPTVEVVRTMIRALAAPKPARPRAKAAVR